MSTRTTGSDRLAPRGWRAELPWIAITLVVVALGQVWAREMPGFPLGSDWGQYLQGADALWRTEHAAPYPSWRGPLYMLLLGGPGQKLGYVAAGQLVSRLAAGLCVLGAATAARVLSGRLAAVIAALLVAGFAPLQQAAVQVNPYATLGAIQGLCLAAGFATARWGWRWTAAATGLLAAAGVATDPRGWMMVPIAVALGLMAPPRLQRPRWGAPAWLLGFLFMGLATTMWFQRDLPRTPLHQAIREQHSLSGEMVSIKTGPAHPLAACLQDDDRAGRLATTPACAFHLLRFNQSRMLSRGYTPPLWALLALPLLLLPQAWGRRSAVVAAVGLGLPGLAMLAGLAWVEWAPRYSVPFAVPLALLGPAAAAALLHRLPWPRLRPWLLAGAMLAWGLTTMPGLRGIEQPNQGMPDESDLLDFARWLDQEAGPGGLVLNCSQQPVDVLLLPTPLQATHHTAGNPETCQRWASHPDRPTGRLILLTLHDPYTGACMGECAGIEPPTLGWQPLELPASTPPGVRGWGR